MLDQEYENRLTRMSLNLLVALANIPSATAGEVIHLWNGKYTFSYHQWPTGSKHVHYHDTTNHFDSRDEATAAMGRFVANFNRELGVP